MWWRRCWASPRRPGFTVTDSVAQALSGRRLLLVLDNCEHVLDAAADLVEAILARTDHGEGARDQPGGLRVPAEQLWPVPSLDVGAGPASAAVELFVERARAVCPGSPCATTPRATRWWRSVARLDGIPLAIELAAARMVSMSPAECLRRLDDRFRLLSGSRRGLERHQTLRHAVQWSYDLLDDDERAVLDRCSVFAGGFDLAAAVHLCGDAASTTTRCWTCWIRWCASRWSPPTGRRPHPLRHAGDDPPVRRGATRRHRHDRPGPGPSCPLLRRPGRRLLGLWDGPGYRVALDWVDAEFANLRAGFRWAADQGDLAPPPRSPRTPP